MTYPSSFHLVTGTVECQRHEPSMLFVKGRCSCIHSQQRKWDFTGSGTLPEVVGHANIVLSDLGEGLTVIPRHYLVILISNDTS